MKNVFVALLLLLVSCKKSDNDYGAIPSCVREHIESLKNSNSSYVNEVDEYLFQGKLVYIFKDDHIIVADGGVSVINSDCTPICFLGGIAGLTTCNGVDFSKNAVLQRVVWKK